MLFELNHEVTVFMVIASPHAMTRTIVCVPGEPTLGAMIKDPKGLCWDASGHPIPLAWPSFFLGVYGQ